MTLLSTFHFHQPLTDHQFRPHTQSHNPPRKSPAGDPPLNHLSLIWPLIIRHVTAQQRFSNAAVLDRFHWFCRFLFFIFLFSIFLQLVLHLSAPSSSPSSSLLSSPIPLYFFLPFFIRSFLFFSFLKFFTPILFLFFFFDFDFDFLRSTL